MASQTIERIAADWLAKRDGDQWTEADEAAFLHWQSQSTLHRVAVIRLRNIWRHADRLQALGAGVPKGSIPPPGQWRVSSFAERRAKTVIAPEPRVLRRWGLLAAAVLVSAAAGIVWYSLSAGPDTYRTAVGDVKALRLADGSRITLNTDSKLHVAMKPSERSIELDRGEAFFDVAKDPARPFVVRAGDKRVVAVGTKFSVLRSHLGIRVVVTEGKVRIEDAARAAREPAVQLDAGNIAHSGGAGVVVTEKSVPEAEQTLSWRSGYIMLRDTTLIEAIEEFNRYNERKLVLGDPVLGELRIGGNLRLTNVDAFVRVLGQGFPIRAEADGKRIVLNRR